MSKKIIVFIIFFIAFFIDRLSKFIVSDTAFIPDGLSMGNNFISIVKVYNAGAAFGILQGWKSFLLLFSVVVMIALIIYVFKNCKKLTMGSAAGIGLILGGTLGNFYDRIVYGYVIDFLKPEFINFPVFNMADIFINLGVALIFIIMLYQSK
ncbi:MAG TPA: signal peptidase II [Candidatus Gastranaerophilales bacterium]|nr:signal peptidase II [Candidatus Gastranaerophilales bacterium]